MIDEQILDSLSFDEIIRLLNDLRVDKMKGAFVSSKESELDDKINTIQGYLNHSPRFK